MDVLEAKEVKNEGIGCTELKCSHSHNTAVILLCQILSFIKKKKKNYVG